jgi:hypothetical protein
VSTLSRLEEAVKELKRTNALIEYEKTQQGAVLIRITKSYEETRSKLIEAEQRYTMAKTDFKSQLYKKDKTIQDLEFK